MHLIKCSQQFYEVDYHPVFTVEETEAYRSKIIHSRSPSQWVEPRFKPSLNSEPVLLTLHYSCTSKETTAKSRNSYFIKKKKLLIKLAVVILVNKIIQVSGIHFYDKWSVYCIVCSPSKVRSSATIWCTLPFTTLHLLPSGNLPYCCLFTSFSFYKQCYFKPGVSKLFVAVNSFLQIKCFFFIFFIF